jgi:hypothetical protein
MIAESEVSATTSQIDPTTSADCLPALDQLGIPWTRPSRYVIAVYRKAAVARLDEFVGPKS